MEKRPWIVMVSLVVFVVSGATLALAQGPGDDLAAAECTYTGEATSGPYYISGAPETDDLNLHDLPGRVMIINGVVYDGSTGDPIPGAQIEVWHTDGAGRYWPQASGEASDFDADQLDLRGTVVTDDEGAYQFASVEPGVYPGRPRHIHYRISADGYLPIFTQTYWAGELAAGADRADPDVDACRILAFEDTEDGATAATFDIYLRPDPDAKPPASTKPTTSAPSAGSKLY